MQQDGDGALYRLASTKAKTPQNFRSAGFLNLAERVTSKYHSFPANTGNHILYYQIHNQNSSPILSTGQGTGPDDKPVFDGKVTGLLLTPTKNVCKWTLRFTRPVTCPRRDASFGVYPEVSIADAREKALTMRRLIDGGKDPVEEPDREQQATRIAAAALTYEKAARELHGELKPGWKNAKHAAQWINTLETYFFPKLGSKKLDAVP